jgi:hypothetical protein
VALRDRLRGPASLLALSASYVARRPGRALPALRVAVEVGIRVRRAPILAPRPGLLVTPDELVEVCSLVSDTHLVAPGHAPVELVHDRLQWPSGRLPDGDQLVAGVCRVLAEIVRHAPRTVVWCGDEVDTGAPEEWQRLRDAMEAVPHLTHWMVPGNHDINFNRPFAPDYDLVRRAERERTYRGYASRVEDFPIHDTIVGDAGPVTIVLLDSCRHRSTHVLSNAIGRFGDAQLAALERVLAHTSGPVLCVAHHHVWRDERFVQPDAWYETAVDSDHLARILFAYRRRATANHVLVCHGHRHVLTAGVIADGDAEIAIVGLPSTTLGDKARTGKLDGILRYGIAGLRRDGSWGVALREAGPLAGDQ